MPYTHIARCRARPFAPITTAAAAAALGLVLVAPAAAFLPLNLPSFRGKFLDDCCTRAGNGNTCRVTRRRRPRPPARNANPPGEPRTPADGFSSPPPDVVFASQPPDPVPPGFVPLPVVAADGAAYECLVPADPGAFAVHDPFAHGADPASAPFPPPGAPPEPTGKDPGAHLAALAGRCDRLVHGPWVWEVCHGGALARAPWAAADRPLGDLAAGGKEPVLKSAHLIGVWPSPDDVSAMGLIAPPAGAAHHRGPRVLRVSLVNGAVDPRSGQPSLGYVLYSCGGGGDPGGAGASLRRVREDHPGVWEADVTTPLLCDDWRLSPPPPGGWGAPLGGNVWCYPV